MQEFFRTFPKIWPDLSSPWLILGKGPTFDRRSELNLDGFLSIALNHAVREQPVDIAHAIDLDVLEACADVVETNARFVVMPWIPHVKNRPGDRSVAELVKTKPILNRLSAGGRLLWYNLSTAKLANGDGPVVPVSFFSAEAALNLLAMAGVRCVRSLGVDGGRNYSTSFGDLADKTLLANGRSSFDRQFEAIAQIIDRTGVDFAPLDVEAPIRIFVGATPDQLLATRVLEYSIRRHASMTTRVEALCDLQINIPSPVDPKNKPRTPFSFQRFLIPEATGFVGHAIYLDSDMLVFRDIKQLWCLPMDGTPLISASEVSGTQRKPQFSVMLLDCKALGWNIERIVAALDSGDLTYERLVYQMEVAPGFSASIPPCWNSLERYAADETALLHYTDMDTQPWLSCVNPLGYLWCRALFEALDRGFIRETEIHKEIRAGHVRPSLGVQVAERIEDPLLLPGKVRALDDGFIPPHASYRRGGGRWPEFPRRLRARVRAGYERSAIHRLSNRIRDRFR